MLSDLVLLQGVELPASSGHIILPGFFRGKKVTIDARFPGVVMTPDGTYHAPKLYCNHYQLPRGDRADDVALEEFEDRVMVKANLLCSMLRYLGNEGSALLEIPAGTPAAVVILGYVRITSNIRWVLYVSRPFVGSADVEEIHLCAHPVGHWNNLAPTMLVVVGQ